jgi:hypothetical protein
MSEQKGIAARIWDRLNPFQSSARVGSFRDEEVFSQTTEANHQPGTSTASEKGWTVVADPGELTPFMPNGVSEAETAGEDKPMQQKRAVRLRPAALSDDRFQVLQKWEGTVLEVEGGVLFARLKDLTQDNPHEEVEIELEEVLSDDRSLVQPGASFYWSIGYLHKSHGQRLRASEIRFRRIPGWTEDEILAAQMQVGVDETFYNLDRGSSCA